MIELENCVPPKLLKVWDFRRVHTINRFLIHIVVHNQDSFYLFCQLLKYDSQLFKKCITTEGKSLATFCTIKFSIRKRFRTYLTWTELICRLYNELSKLILPWKSFALLNRCNEILGRCIQYLHKNCPTDFLSNTLEQINYFLKSFT